MSQIIFGILLITTFILFIINTKKIIANIQLGKVIQRNDNKILRWKTMLKVAFGQSKMVTRPIPFIMHLFVYIGFIIINIEVLEIIIDGLLGTHRIFAFLGGFYNFLIAAFEILALLVLIGVLVFLSRRTFIHLKRFSGIEMKAWPKTDAIIILTVEVLLMLAFLTMNAADYKIQLHNTTNIIKGAFPISKYLLSILPDNLNQLYFIERFSWWFHIIGIFAFLNYLPYSKHFHIILAFPNTWFSNLNQKGRFNNMESVTNEVKTMLDPTFTSTSTIETLKFGAKDVEDLNRIQLLNAYTCTECGRCTSVCPANITGKLLSPRKIMMDTRDRLEEKGKAITKKTEDNKTLLDDYITREEIWACTSCNACTEACPVNIDPLSIILDLRRYIVMEESKAPNSINNMFSNIENNGAPWKYAPADRFNWANR